MNRMGTCECGAPAVVQLNGGKPYCQAHYERELDRIVTVIREAQKILR